MATYKQQNAPSWIKQKRLGEHNNKFYNMPYDEVYRNAKRIILDVRLGRIDNQDIAYFRTDAIITPMIAYCAEESKTAETILKALTLCNNTFWRGVVNDPCATFDSRDLAQRAKNLEYMYSAKEQFYTQFRLGLIEIINISRNQTLSAQQANAEVDRVIKTNLMRILPNFRDV